MLVLDTHYDEPDDTDLETLVIDDAQRRRSRFRTRTDSGRTVGVVREGDQALETGDVLGTAEEPIAVVRLERREAAVIDLDAVQPTTDRLLALARLGHALGNRHRELAVRGSQLLVPVTDGRERLEGELRPWLPDGIQLEYVAVDPGLFDQAEHSPGHDHAGDHSHPHDHAGHSHSHEYAGGHSHDHDGDVDLDIVPDGGYHDGSVDGWPGPLTRGLLPADQNGDEDDA